MLSPAGLERAVTASGGKYQLIPCGRCAACKLAYSREWAIRCQIESSLHNQNCFVTLTYEPGQVPTINTYTREIYRGYIGQVNDGVVTDTLTLWPEDVTKFIKRLRKHIAGNNKSNIKYFYCGEYGSTTFRPHYHILVFGWQPDDLEYWKTVNGYPYFLSESLSRVWGHGFITVGQVTWETAAYTARYTLKKLRKADEWDRREEFGLLPEYVRMSLKPGIGREYYELNKEKIYELDEIILPREGKARVVKPPKYYDKMFDIEQPNRMEEIREARETVARMRMQSKMSGTTRDLWQQLKAEQEAKERAIRQLIRPLD